MKKIVSPHNCTETPFILFCFILIFCRNRNNYMFRSISKEILVNEKQTKTLKKIKIKTMRKVEILQVK